jgi:hypothetical protein
MNNSQLWETILLFEKNIELIPCFAPLSSGEGQIPFRMESG